jgi:hypothetical protein
MQLVSPQKTKKQIEAIIVKNEVTQSLLDRLSAVEQKLNRSSNVLDGVSLEELVNFSVPLTGAQRQDQLEDGVLLAYKDGKLVEESDLNGGNF